ncbi:MAG: GNAT family N-acetyltransferase [Ruminiclostridium sp.]|nr:GNAT family N-acetyltransferase [Ruminiclostridium sp.]
MMIVNINTLTESVFLELYCSVGWEPPSEEQVKIALKNSLATFTVYDADKPVGMLRLLGDCAMSFYIKDFAVIPSYQSKGVGSLLMESAEKYINENKLKGCPVSLELISSKEAVAFYKKKGFEERPCDWDGPGMFKMIK